MKLKLQRSQKSGLTGSITFKMLAIVDLDTDEAAAVKKYKLGKEVVYTSPKGEAATAMLASGALKGITATIAAKATNQIWTVDDLIKGKEIACKDVTEMIAAEEQIREACQGLARILFVCQHFEGEEVIDIEPFDPEG